MKVYTINNLFLFGGATNEKHPYLVVGRQYQPETAIFTNLQTVLDNFRVPILCSAEMLDIQIAAALSNIKPRPFLIGCTISVPWISSLCGGVLGNPGHVAESAKGELEDLKDGWKLLSFPGGPGLAFKEGARDAFHPEVKTTGIIGKELLLNLATQAYGKGVEELLALTDGTGCGSAGSVMIQYRRNYIICSLEEITNSLVHN